MDTEDQARYDDHHFMTIAIEEARRSVPEKDGRIHPLVGVVVVRDGKELARSHRTEGRHGEYIALEQSLGAEILAGATVYTTLEPCTHRGPDKKPCADRLISRRVGRVVIGMHDPDPNIRGLGVQKLERARVQVDFFPSELREQIEDLNRTFIAAKEKVEIRSADRSSEASSVPGADSGESEEKLLDNDERQAMRAFLQRGEVRLSTMHRIAGAFLGGAGLLFLLPVFFRDYPRDLAAAFVTTMPAGPLQWLAAICMLGLLLISLLIPIYSLYLLMKDIILFYFIGHSPGFSDDRFYPRFALTAIAFSPDESPRIKHRILEYERSNDLVTFAIPFSSNVKTSEFSTWQQGGKSLLPGSRTIASDASEKHKQFMVALGQAGLIDRDLVGEVAKMEVSLVRHNVHLRRLVLRYAKALLLMIWTIVVSFFIALGLSMVKGTPLQPYSWVAVVTFYGVWLALTALVVRRPLDWIYEWANQNTQKDAIVKNDPELTHFETQVSRLRNWGWIVWCLAALAAIASASGVGFNL